MQNPNITANNIVEEISKQVKHYPQEPMYVITHLDNFCHYEIFIDDNVAFNEFDDLSPDAFNINQFIYKKGIHSNYTYSITNKLYHGILTAKHELLLKAQISFTAKIEM